MPCHHVAISATKAYPLLSVGSLLAHVFRFEKNYGVKIISDRDYPKSEVIGDVQRAH
jgi:hypothetical protein